METISPPKVPKDQIQPLTEVQQDQLLEAARQSRYPLRDEALVLLLLDTGTRAEETVALTFGDVNLAEGYAIIKEGKGGKKRRVRISSPTRRALANYLRLSGRQKETPVFLAEGGTQTGTGLTGDGLYQLIVRLGENAGIEGVRCSPHTLRHTFAVEFVRGGGNLFTLMEMLGHTSLTMSKRYVALADADLAEQHRQFSPVERLLRRGKGR